jgi:intraflagellar transport protein 172
MLTNLIFHDMEPISTENSLEEILNTIMLFMCCRCSQKAIESCIQARQWSKAVQIIEMQDPSIGANYYQQIADHYSAIKDYQLAEQYYLKADMSQQAVDMYIKADQWEEAYRLAVGCMAQEDLSQLYTSRAKQLEDDGKLKGARIIIINFDVICGHSWTC